MTIVLIPSLSSPRCSRLFSLDHFPVHARDENPPFRRVIAHIPPDLDDPQSRRTLCSRPRTSWYHAYKTHSPCETLHSVPPFGYDPYKWLAKALAVISQESDKFDVLICTQEQVAIISAEIEKVRDLGTHVAVPDFGSLKMVMDKVSAYATLQELGLSQPESMVLSSIEDLERIDRSGQRGPSFPAYVKLPIATASTGVRRVRCISELKEVVQEWRPFDQGIKLLLQCEVVGPLLMICGIFSHGTLVAWHACLRAREGVNGGASKKVSCPLPAVESELSKLGKALKWHGALSADVIWIDKTVRMDEEEKEPVFIDINPRIVEPMNGLLAGVDLVAALLDVSFDKKRENETLPQKGQEGVQTHQLVLALLAAAKEGRISLMTEVWMAIRGCDGYYGYKGSAEELTPTAGDWWSVAVLVGMTILLLGGGRWMVEKLSGGTIQSYAVSPQGWKVICERVDDKRLSTQMGE